jgi:hypothetical protein
MTANIQPPTELYSDEHIFHTTRTCIDAWNAGDLEWTLSTYTNDVSYRDPKIRGVLNSNADLRRYLDKFFKVWGMTFTVTDERRIAGENSQLCMWDCAFVHLPSGREVTISGMDLCVVRGDQLSTDHAFMDTLPLERVRLGSE